MPTRTGPRTPSLRSDVRMIARGWRWFRRPLVPRSVEARVKEPREFPTAWARSDTAVLARAALQRYALAPLLRIETSSSIEGRDVLDDLSPPVIFVANHASHLDAPFVLTSLPKRWAERTATGAAADYFFDVWWRAAATALVFNAFPVERSRARGRTTRLARELLSQGWNVLVFPEGTRSPDGWVREFRLGAARLALEMDVPVVPIGIRGSYQSMPRGRGWPVKGRPPVRLRFGRPVRPRPGEDASTLSERMRDALAVTLQEDRTSWWDAMRREVRGEVEPVDGPLGARWRRMWEASRPLQRPARPMRRR